MQQGKVNNGGQNNYTTQIGQGLTWVHGKHEFKMGWDMRRLETLSYDLAGTNGTYVFARNETANPAATSYYRKLLCQFPARLAGFRQCRGHTGAGRRNSLPVLQRLLPGQLARNTEADLEPGHAL